jgi:bifunctional DNA-binding transcriptional regulator/antitoxin component of YhaV-PrlF toxin-antitoxin module
MIKAPGSNLKALGIVRKIDSLGRLVIPMEFKKMNGWEPGTSVEMFADQEGGLYIRAYGQDSEKEKLIDQLVNISNNAASKETNDAIIKAISYLRKGE